MVRVLFLHPDLGIGGAERLVVDAALALKRSGHEVSFLTNHHDRNHCFEETKNGSFPVEVIGDWLPRKIFGRLQALCAYIKMIHAAFYVTMVLSRRKPYDVIFCDLISVGIPILRFASGNPYIIFYCHFPDQLLSPKGGLLKSIYRAPLNYFEEYTTGLADKVLVNSKFTCRTFRETFRRLTIVPDVLYPSLNTDFFDKMLSTNLISRQTLPRDSFVFLSINRFERKKDVKLAVEAFHHLQFLVSRNEFENLHLVVAGGYDERVDENVEHYKELTNLIKKLELTERVTLLRSPSDTEKIALLKRCNCLVYTPENEHFGIVPLEAMYLRKPVIASNSGGPTETIINDSTGLLCEHTKENFADGMLKMIRNNQLAERMGEMGRKRVEQKFSFDAFKAKLNGILAEMME